MNKPDWKDAPEWANWLGCNVDGDWFWFEDEPAPNNKGSFHVPTFKFILAGKPDPWNLPLERRP
jgi:hypothetical protein